MGIFDSEKLGRRVRQVWMDWAEQQPDILDRPDWLDPWEKLPERIQDADKKIGTAIAGDVFAELQSEHAAYQLRIAALEAALRQIRELTEDYEHNQQLSEVWYIADSALTPEGGVS